jgi:hypothetical protein
MANAEATSARERENYQQVKRLEDSIAELQYMKQKTMERYLSLERENEGLKEKLDALLDTASRRGSGELSTRALMKRVLAYRASLSFGVASGSRGQLSISIFT